MSIRRKLLIGIMAISVLPISAQEQRIKEPEKISFKPHWFIQAQIGAAHTVGEAKFTDLISPAAALNVGYKFAPAFGARVGVSLSLIHIYSAKIQDDQQAKISSLVEYLEKHSAAKVSVTGYADKETGNPNINMTLSEKRAKNVIEMLKAKGVAADRIVIGYKGDTVPVSYTHLFFIRYSSASF